MRLHSLCTHFQHFVLWFKLFTQFFIGTQALLDFKIFTDKFNLLITL
jgi:hypothetical protein